MTAVNVFSGHGMALHTSLSRHVLTHIPQSQHILAHLSRQDIFLYTSPVMACSHIHLQSQHILAHISSHSTYLHTSLAMASPYTHELTEAVTERTWLVEDRACQKFSVVREGIARAKSFPQWKATNHW